MKLNERTVELLLHQARDGKLVYRVGTILQVPKMRGQTVLLLDYDSPTGQTLHKPNLKALRERLSLAGVSLVQAYCNRSPSGRGWHIIAIVRGRWNRFQRIALQAICESDPEHCALAFNRAQVYSEKTFNEIGCVLFTKEGNQWAKKKR